MYNLNQSLDPITGGNGDEFYSFQIDELRVYLKKAFGLRLAEGATIAVN